MTQSLTIETIRRWTDEQGVEHRAAGPTYSRDDFTQLLIAQSQAVAANTAAALWDPRAWTGHPFQTFDYLEVWYEDDEIGGVLLELTANEGNAQENIFLVELISGVPFRLGSDTSAFNIIAGNDAFTIYGVTPDVIDRLRVKNVHLTRSVTLYMTMGKV
jgi:hypothetical protein